MELCDVQYRNPHTPSHWVKWAGTCGRRLNEVSIPGRMVSDIQEAVSDCGEMLSNSEGLSFPSDKRALVGSVVPTGK